MAGLSLDESIERDRALRFPEGAAAAPAPLGIEEAARDGVVFSAGGPGDDVPPLTAPMVRGEGGVRLRTTRLLDDGAVRFRFGASVRGGDDHAIDFDGSEASIRLASGRLYASVERRHWGPGWTQSLILDAGSRPVPAIGWRKDDSARFASPWLAWLGPWHADFFAGELTQRSGPARPHLLGGRLEVMPIDGLAIGFSRTIQWGGKGRPEGIASLYHALVGDDNASTADELAMEPGNQLGGFDFRYTLRLPDGRSLGLYSQAIGEDEHKGLPSKFLGSYGADAAFSVESVALRTFVEHSNTAMRGVFGKHRLAGAYQHHIYTDGYTQLGDPLGHPVGGDVRLTSLGLIADAGRWTASLVAHRGLAFDASQLYGRGGRLSGAHAELAWQATPRSRFGFALDRWRDPEATLHRAQLWCEFALQ